MAGPNKQARQLSSADLEAFSLTGEVPSQPLPPDAIRTSQPNTEVLMQCSLGVDSACQSIKDLANKGKPEHENAFIATAEATARYENDYGYDDRSPRRGGPKPGQRR